jgi:hypothetical protein
MSANADERVKELEETLARERAERAEERAAVREVLLAAETLVADALQDLAARGGRT